MLLAEIPGVRGPTLALFAKVARGVPFGKAMEDVARAASIYDDNVYGNGAFKSMLRFPEGTARA